MKIVLEIKSCKECPFFKTERVYSADSYERDEDWICTKESKIIEGSVSHWEENGVKIPTWCPAKAKDL